MGGHLRWLKAIVFALIVPLMTAPSVARATVIYEYLGSNFTESAIGTITTADRVSGFIEFASDPLAGSDGIFDIVSWGFSVAGTAITSEAGDEVLSAGFYFSFDASGEIVAWDFSVTEAVNVPGGYDTGDLIAVFEAGEITASELQFLASLPTFPTEFELNEYIEILSNPAQFTLLSPFVQSVLSDYVSFYIALGGGVVIGDSIHSCSSDPNGSDICDGDPLSSDIFQDLSLTSATVNDNPGVWTRQNVASPDPTPVAEPPAAALVWLGLLAFIVTRRWRYGGWRG